MDLTQQKINNLKQNLQQKRIKLELLDINMHTIETLEGIAISGSITANADSDIRRQGNITLAIPTAFNGSMDIFDGEVFSVGGKIWLDKYIKISVGINNEWYKMGVFLINQPTRKVSATEYTLSFNCVDLMAKLTGLRQGQLTERNVDIPQGTIQDGVYVRTKTLDTIISTITELGHFYKYAIYPIPSAYEYLPYDIKLSTDSTVYDILKNIKEILPTWQMYFDLDGTFIFEPIPSGENGVVFDLDRSSYISDDLSLSFENVKNQVVVYGRTNSLSYYTENVAYENGTLILKYASVNPQTLTIGGVTFGFLTLPKPNTEPLTKVEIWSGDTQLIYSHGDIKAELVKYGNSTSSFGKNYETTQIEVDAIPANEICFIRIFSTQDSKVDDNGYIDINQSMVFEFMGKENASYTLVNDNKESPFYINASYQQENYYAGLATTPNGSNYGEVYDLTLNSDNVLLTNGTIITFMANANNISGAKINLKANNMVYVAQNIPLVANIWENEKRPIIQANKVSNNYTIYELRYETANGGQLVFMGRCPYALSKIFSGGEYDNIKSDQLAYERCVWELYSASNLNDSISLSIVPNYLLDVNRKIPYDTTYFSHQSYVVRGKQFKTNNKKNFYVKKSSISYFIIKNITFPLSVDNTGQSITANRIYSSGNLIGG